MSDKKGMKPEHKIFCHEYIYDWNATRSYKVAYPNQKSDNSAASNASRLLRNDKVQAYIEEIQKNLEKAAGLSKLMMLNKLNEVIEDEDKEYTTQANKIKAIENVNKMLGYNDPEKSDVTSGGEPIKGITPMQWVDGQD